MEEGASRDCRSWNEEIYWTHFQYVHFSRFLHAGFDQCLAIPENFTRNLPRKLPNTVTLKSPSGIKWEIGLTANDNSLFFEHGWKEFVKYHSLEENDILVFKYNGESHFDVLMFNGWSMCEKTACYFLRKHGPKEHDSGCQIKREIGKKSAGVVIGSCPKKKPKNKNIHTPIKQPVISKFAKNVTAGNKEPCDEDIEAKPDIKHREKEIQCVLQLAHATLTDKGFIVMMKPTHVSRKFFMSIPSAWMTKHISCRENQDVILRMKENTWRTRLYYRRKPNRGGLACGGWRSFVLDNKLREFDVCVFEPGSLDNESVVLDVKIFHVKK
uniref:TF-B3 domain-containing protein n=1 Tax=Manihot esculenta TaxID=3983 RepID=A0A2C9TZZ9_MANES